MQTLTQIDKDALLNEITRLTIQRSLLEIILMMLEESERYTLDDAAREIIVITHESGLEARFNIFKDEHVYE